MKGMFIPEITVEMFRNACLESIEALMAEGEVYDIEYNPKSEEQDVPDTNVGKWIPCSERLPEVGQKVLASTNKTCFTQVFKGTSGASNSSWWWEKKTIKHIFAWMPCPEPWNGGKE